MAMLSPGNMVGVSEKCTQRAARTIPENSRYQCCPASMGEKKKLLGANTESFVARVKESAQVMGYRHDAAKVAKYQQVQRDVARTVKYLRGQHAELISMGDLQDAYPGEANSWRRALDPDTRQEGVAFDHAAFSDFRNWLLHLGPKLSESDTADRIDGSRGYEVGNLRWATKEEQAINRKGTRWLVLPDGRNLTRKQLAKELGIKLDTLKHRINRKGLAYVLSSHNPNHDHVREWDFPPGYAAELERLYRESRGFSQSRLDFYISHLKNCHTEEPRYRERTQLAELINGAEAELSRRRSLNRNAMLSKHRELIDSVLSSHQPINLPSLPGLPPPKPAEPVKPAPATACMVVKPKPCVEPPATHTPEQVQAIMQRFMKR